METRSGSSSSFWLTPWLHPLVTTGGGGGEGEGGRYDSVVTIGGEQSNHCRATAAAARMVGLDPHLILRTKRADEVMAGSREDLGYTGNVLVDRMVGSTIYTCTPGEYGRVGSRELVRRVCDQIGAVGETNNRAYPIPVGGSNGLGTWGYINAVDELLGQTRGSSGGVEFDHVVFACGSGGTAAGISLGFALSSGAAGGDGGETETLASAPSAPAPKVHAIGVCDDPNYFYRTVADIADEMGLSLPPRSSASMSTSTEEFVRRHLIAHQGKGLGYASSTKEELDFVTEFCVETGIVLDPVYSGKALYHFVTRILEEEDSYRGSNVLFWHTGGALGMYDKGDTLLETLGRVSPVKRLDVYGKGGEGTVQI